MKPFVRAEDLPPSVEPYPDTRLFAPHMEEVGDWALFQDVLRSSRVYFEFGAGGSTGVAATTKNLVSVTSVDSDARFVASVRDARLGTRVRAYWANVGPVRMWGTPDPKLETSCRGLYPNYAESYAALRDNGTDVVFVDGRFRVSCVLEVLATGDRPLFIVHDFLPREKEHYADMDLVLQRVRCGGSMCAFRARPSVTQTELAVLREKHRWDVA